MVAGELKTSKVFALCSKKPRIKCCFAANKKGKAKKHFHLGICAARAKVSLPSVALALGAIGTPPPSQGKFMAAKKIALSKFCKGPPSKLSFRL